MNNYAMRIEVNDKEVKEILDELTNAQKKIYECYNRLGELGVIHFIKDEETISEN